MRLLVDIEVPYAFDVPEVRARIIEDVRVALDGMGNEGLIMGDIRITEVPVIRLKPQYDPRSPEFDPDAPLPADVEPEEDEPRRWSEIVAGRRKRASRGFRSLRS